MLLLLLIISLVPRPSAPPVLIAYSMQKYREKARGILSRDCSMADVMDSRFNGLFTFLLTAIEKLDKLQRRSRSYL